MKTPDLSGTGVALVTPFNEKREVDFPALKKLMDFTQKNGVDYFVVLGTTGESATLKSDEKREILEFIKKNNQGSLPIVYGLGGNNTQSLLDELREVDLDGIDAILSVSPYYNKPSQQGIIAHYTALADSSRVPIILYNVPGRTSSNLTADTTLALAKHENIIGTKEAAGDLAQAMKIAAHKPDDFLLISGDDLLTLPLMSVGGAGVISVLANALPDTFRRMMEGMKSGEIQKAAKATFELLEINPLMYEESNPTGIKYMLSEMGICKPFVRLPLVEASESLKLRIRKAMESM